MKTITLLLCVIWVFSCSDEEGQGGQGYQIPRFAVHPLSGGGLPNGEGLASFFNSGQKKGLKHLVLAPMNILFPLALRPATQLRK